MMTAGTSPATNAWAMMSFAICSSKCRHITPSKNTARKYVRSLFLLQSRFSHCLPFVFVCLMHCNMNFLAYEVILSNQILIPRDTFMRRC